jgi:hypothetical protein
MCTCTRTRLPTVFDAPHPFLPPQGRLVIWGSTKAVGGAEALLQLWRAASSLGLAVHFMGTLTGDLFATDMPGPPSPDFTSVYGTPGSLLHTLTDLEPGDTVITRSDLPEGCYGNGADTHSHRLPVPCSCLLLLLPGHCCAPALAQRFVCCAPDPHTHSVPRPAEEGRPGLRVGAWAR